LGLLKIRKNKYTNFYQFILLLFSNNAKESGIQPLIKFVGLLKGHWSSIVNYFDTKLTNGILEGINSKIQLAKRRARGFRNIKNFINMIRLICGKLKICYPIKTL